ncbi:MAG: 50S ribosomal protein L11 methyltransferase [Chromatiales bacterium]|nr:MAG: 50S ribosomal protein L11 methyltransferase [Chromatiales bacterium]
MDWLQVQIELGRLAPEPVEAALLQLGALAIEYADAGNEPLLEPAPGDTPLWSEVVLSALLSPDTPAERVRLAVAAAVAPAALPPVRFRSLPDQDWVRNFRRTLTAQRFGARLWIVPPSAELPPAPGAVVRLEPGLAFGSGRHETTALCLEWLDALGCGGTVLDYGCGSGVLAIAALALGATNAVGVDIDPQAREACADNAARNGVSGRLEVLAPDDLAPGRRFDAVVANILSGPLMELAPALGPRLLPAGAIALTGILVDQAATVRDCYADWVHFDAPILRGDWVLLSGRSRGRI